jgi:hypothetical protein
MADKKISDLVEVTSLLPTDEFELARSGVSNRISAANVVAVSTQNRTSGVIITDPLGDVLSAAVGKAYVLIPLLVDLTNLIDAVISVSTPATSGTTIVQLRRFRAGVSAYMLSTALTIDVGGYNSLSATIPAVIDTANDDVQVGDMVFFDITTAGNDAKGLFGQLTFET